ncbi:MAG: cell division protein FtsQ [Salinisphaeraceae bacterium]|jgi:cell division protein FtsQ|nr:cell division protein FtsQ [Salinisphaeraceae bacterium]
MTNRFYSMVVLACGLTLVTALAACTWQGMQSESDIATRKLYIVGALQQIDDQLVARRAQPYLNASFFDVDVTAIQDAVGTIAWVDSVTVHRRWPDAVVIRLAEREPVARWGDSQLLAADGELFEPVDRAGFSHLPQLAGPTGSGLKVLAQWRALKPALREAGFDLQALEQDPRGGWHALLDGGLELRLGDAHITTRLDRLVSNLTPGVRDQLRTAAYVDLRYSDGFAIGGDRPIAKQDNSLSTVEEQA